MDTLGSRLRALREKRKLGITDIAVHVGVSPSTYRDWEHGREIKGEPYMSLALILGVSLSYLLTGKEVREEINHLEQIEVKLLAALNHVKSIKVLL